MGTVIRSLQVANQAKQKLCFDLLKHDGHQVSMERS
jgi:hypothetical protein